MSLIQKILFTVTKNIIMMLRPLMGNRNYTRRYIKLLRRHDVDIAPYKNCGFIATSVYFDKYDFTKIHIGCDVFLTHDVVLLVHDQSLVTAWNSEEKRKDKGSFYGARDIFIGDNVFIGMRTVVLPGATIEDDVIIGAGSVVKGRIPKGTVWAGNPARMIETTEEYMRKLRERGAFEIRDYSMLPKEGK